MRPDDRPGPRTLTIVHPAPKAPLTRRQQRIVSLARRTVTAKPGEQTHRIAREFTRMGLTPDEKRLASRAASQHGERLRSMQPGFRETIVRPAQKGLETVGLGGAAHPIRRTQHPGGRMEFPGFGGPARVAASDVEALLAKRAPKPYQPRTLRLGEHEQQIPRTRSRIARVGERAADKASALLQSSERARATPLLRLGTTEQRVTKAAGRAQRVEAERAQAAVAEHLHVLSKVKKGSHEDVAHFWYAQLPARLRNAQGLRLVQQKQREHLSELTSGKFSENLSAREKSLQAKRRGLTFGTPEWSRITNELERLGLARADLPRRIQDTSTSVALLEQVAARNPAVKPEVVNALHALGSERKRILTEAQRLKPEKAASREGLVSRWLGIEPTGEEVYVGHRAPRRGQAAPAAPSAGVGRARSPRGVGTRNRLVLAETGRLRPSVHVAAEDWQHAQVFEQANKARRDLARMGQPFRGHVPEGHVLVNPKGRTIPAHWRSDELAQFGDDWEDIARVRKQAEEISGGFAAKHPEAIERLKAEADAAGVKRSELRILREDLAERYYKQFRRMTPPRGKGLKALDLATDAVATSIIFARLGYVPKNLAQNVIMMVPHQGPLLLRNVARAAQVMSDRRLRTLIRAEVGFSGASRELGSELGTWRKLPGKVARFSGSIADDTARVSAFLHEAAAAGVIAKVSPLLGEQDRRALLRLLTDKTQRPLLNDIRSRSVEAMADFSRLTPDQVRLARRFLVIPSWLMAGSRYPFHFAVNHPVRSALLAYVAAGEPGAPERLHFNKPIGEYFTKGVAPWLEGIALGDKTLRTGSLSPVNTPWELGKAAVQTARGKQNPFDFTHETAFDYAAPLASTAVDFASGGGVLSLERLAPGEKFVRQMIRPEASKYYPEDRTRLGRLKRELGVIPIETSTPREMMSPHERALADFTDLRSSVKQAVKEQFGLDAVPPKLAKRLDLLEERATARAKYGSKTSLQRFASDIRVIRRHGWINDAEARQALRWARSATKEDISRKGIRYLTESFFDRDRMASGSLRYLNELAALNTELARLVQSGQISKAEAAKARAYAKDNGLDEVRDGRSYLHSHYRPPKSGWPSADTLSLPR